MPRSHAPLVLLTILILPLRADALTTIDFGSLGTFTTPALQIGALTVTGENSSGAAQVQVIPLGLGIVGGAFDGNVDFEQAELIAFAFAVPVVDVTYSVEVATEEPGGNFIPGERLLEAFDAGGSSLGTWRQDGIGLSFNVSALVGNQPISRFSLLALATDHFIVRGLRFNPVPEPGTALVLGVALVGISVRRRVPKAR